mmetsp:Transcript_14674/g.20946  ORF Transcript_14674/g.20946 Transcript_14674/m.20946 type:complete len:152 (+) Transcript_14674:181-636(+)
MLEKRKRTEDPVASKKKRQYFESYLDLGFIEVQDSRPECIICGEKLANESMKPSKLKQHQETKHNNTIGESREYFERKKQLALSKRSMDIRKSFERAGSDLHRATEVSFECLLLIAKTKKPHNIDVEYLGCEDELCNLQADFASKKYLQDK